MLRREHSICEYDFGKGLIRPDRLTRNAHAHYLPFISKILDIYRQGIGNTRQQLHQKVESAFDALSDCPAKRIASFTKLLDDVSTFETDRYRKAAKLRTQVFRLAAQSHPLVQNADHMFSSDQRKVKDEIAQQLETPWEQIEQTLFSDVIEFHPLLSFQGYQDPAQMLARYNVAQVQACLYRATRMTLWAQRDLKTIVRAIKLSRLMHSIQRTGPGQYTFTLDGPSSSLRQTRRYGVPMASMIPVLLSCQDWKLHAPIAVGNSGYHLSLNLTSQDGLNSGKEIAGGFDSKVEEDLMAKWMKSPSDSWSLKQESEILHAGQKVFTPDFVATHTSGKQVFIEIVGYWTPEYLKAKVETLAKFPDVPIIVIAQQDKQTVLESMGLPLDSGVLWYKTTITLKSLRQRLESFAGSPTG